MQASKNQSPHSFRLNDLEVNPVSGLVSGPGGEVRLEPRVMSLLLELASRPGELVTRAELLAEIWPGDGIYDEALTQCVYQLRLQLGEAGGGWHGAGFAADSQRFGARYRVSAVIQPVDDAAVAGQATGRFS